MMTPQAATRGQVPSSALSPADRVVTRFAPSPTGPLHLGHAYSALATHDFARARGGRFLLRIENIDPGRSRPEHVAGIIEDLTWLGLSWDGEVIFQSQRLDLYAAALDRLRGAGLLYPCFCTRRDIAASASAPHGPEGLVYPGTCRSLSPDERDRLTRERPHAWRLDMAEALTLLSGQGQGALQWTDGGHSVSADPARFGDVVLARKDAPVSYHLAVTIDDAAQEITDVVRGVDLFESTDVHRLLQALLGLPTPRYHHHPLITDGAGRRLAKRDGAPTLAELRARGEDPGKIAEMLRIGRLPAGYSAAGT